MMNVSTLTVLLVCVILECAHSASFERGWERFSPRSKRSTVNRVSIVESWDSVCEEVCRAGYGGPGCGVVGCNAQSTLGNSEKFQAICPNLCENALGGTKCDCALSPMNPNLSSARNSLCSETCSWRTSLSGCSKCVKAVGTTNRDDSSTTIDGITDDTGITDDYGTTNTTEEQVTTTEEYSTDEEDTTTDENSTSESDEDDSTTEEATTTTSTTTTTQATTTTRTTTQATTTTTPNWESLCEALCRNGEGGSLCNCDIPPFF